MGDDLMSKQLTLASVDKQYAKEFKGQKKIILKTGDYILIQEKFKKTSIQQLVLDYTEILEEIKKKKINADSIKDVTFIYYILLLKHFTNLDNIPTDINSMVIVCEKLIDLDILEEIIEAMPVDEMNKVETMVKKISENSEVIGSQIGDIFAKLAIDETLKGDDIKDARIQQS